MSYPYKRVNKYVCMYMYAHIYLILGFSQMFCLMGNHFFVGIEALGMDEKKRKLKHDENDDLCIKKWFT